MDTHIPTNMRTIEQASWKELENILETSFEGCPSVTVREVSQCLASHGFKVPPILATGRIYHVLHSIGFSKKGDIFTRKDLRSTPRNALVKMSTPVAYQPAPMPPQTDPMEVFMARQGKSPLPIARTDFADGEARIRDIDLGAFLGFSRPVNIRKLIARHSVALGIVSTVETIPEGAGRPGQESWLTEHQAIDVCAKCETPIANEILQQVINVFVAVRKAAAATGQSLGDVIATLGAISKATAEGFAMMEAQQHDRWKAMDARLAVVEARGESSAPTSSSPPPAPAPVVEEWLEIWQWSQKTGNFITSRERARVGTIAKSLTLKMGLVPRTRPSTKFGTVNLYPRVVLDQVWNERVA